MCQPDIYQLYKPLRNHLRQLSIEDSMYVLWAYSQHYAFKNKMPIDIETIPEFRDAKDWHEKKLYPWEIDSLTRETFINAQNKPNTKKTLKSWSYFTGAINKLKEFENEISGIYSNERNILVAIFRISHQQFPWQSGANQIQLIRYYKIFSHEGLSKLVEDEVGLTTRDLYMVSMMFTGAYVNSPAVTFPVNIQTQLITSEKVNLYLRKYCIELDDLVNQLKEGQSLDEKFVHAFTPLSSRPIIKMNYRGTVNLVCPTPTKLFWRVTSGLFFDICGKDGFGNLFGESFQNYVGAVCHTAQTKPSFTIIPEESYKVGRGEKDTTDWVIDEGESALFIECKAKRIKQIAKEEVLDEKPLKEQLSVLAKSIFQLYKSIHDYKQGLYPNIAFDESKKIFPLVLTLESWYAFGDYVYDYINSEVRSLLSTSEVPLTYLEDMPYTTLSISEFEVMIQVIQTTGIKSFMEGKTATKEKCMWAMESYIHSAYKKEAMNTCFLFEKEMEDFMPSKAELS